MRKPIIIGKNEFKYKKDAIAFYRAILNSYDYNESLTDEDYYNIFDLLEYGHFFCDEDDIDTEPSDTSENIDEAEDSSLTIDDIKVSKVQFNTKCFELFYSDKTSQYISYLMLIKQKRYTPEELFYTACRNAVHSDVRAVKQKYFDDNSVKGQVKCQETGILSKWTELVIDHRQPNTFSIIVDRFKEVNRFDLDTIEYTSNEQNHIIFEDEDLAYNFREYHKEKANLRIVRKECNSSRTGMARVKESTRDLKVKGKVKNRLTKASRGTC